MKKEEQNLREWLENLRGESKAFERDKGIYKRRTAARHRLETLRGEQWQIFPKGLEKLQTEHTVREESHKLREESERSGRTFEAREVEGKG